jgi:hypothetical protein
VKGRSAEIEKEKKKKKKKKQKKKKKESEGAKRVAVDRWLAGSQRCCCLACRAPFLRRGASKRAGLWWLVVRLLPWLLWLVCACCCAARRGAAHASWQRVTRRGRCLTRRGEKSVRRERADEFVFAYLAAERTHDALCVGVTEAATAPPFGCNKCVRNPFVGTALLTRPSAAQGWDCSRIGPFRPGRLQVRRVPGQQKCARIGSMMLAITVILSPLPPPLARDRLRPPRIDAASFRIILRESGWCGQ